MGIYIIDYNDYDFQIYSLLKQLLNTTRYTPVIRICSSSPQGSQLTQIRTHVNTQTHLQPLIKHGYKRILTIYFNAIDVVFVNGFLIRC